MKTKIQIEAIIEHPEEYDAETVNALCRESFQRNIAEFEGMEATEVTCVSLEFKP